MGSRKPSAKRRQVERFREGLGAGDAFDAADGFDWLGALAEPDDAFAREDARARRAQIERDADLRRKACESKNRYAHYSDAQEALDWSVQRGRANLRIYECPYCGGWHLTSKPER